MSIYSEIDRLELAKENLKLKLESKGIIVPANAKISDYAALINLLPEIEESEFTNRIVDNGNSGTGKAKIYNIKGRGLIWNQLGKNVSSKTVADFTVINNADGTLRITGTNTRTSVTYFSICDRINHIPVGHKILIIGTPNGGETTEKHYQNVSTYAVWAQLISTSGIDPICPIRGHIITANSISSLAQSVDYLLNIIIGASQTIDIIVRPQFIDLTLMFGKGNEPTTVEEFKTIFPEVYYPYNAGTPINNDAEAIESIGFNQWDEEWENGAYSVNTGEKIASDGIRSKNYIKVLPNTTYYPKRPNGTTWIAIMAYNSNKEFIQSLGGLNDEFTTPLDCYYITFYTPNAYSIYNNDICINISNPDKNGTYEPYKKVTCNLGLNSFRVKDNEDNIITVNGLKSAGSAYDEITDKYIKRIGEVDLGTLVWYGSNGIFYTNTDLIRRKTSSNNLLCVKYTTIAPTSALGTNGICQRPGSANETYINIIDSAYTDATTFKAALSGVILYYELSTPIEYDLVDEIDTIYDVDKNGVERIISPAHADGSPSAPFRASIGYPVNQKQ